MQHAEFRRLFGADPRRSEPEVLAHRASCAECDQYARDLERVDALVRGASNDVPKPAPPPWEIEARRSTASPAARWYALAATVLLAVALGAGMLWAGKQRDALIVEVVKHADRERDVLVTSDKRASEAKIRRALAAGGATMVMDLPISIARTCKIRGTVAPHLVLQTRDGAVAVLLLTKERFLVPHDFAAQGYEGTLVPKGSHSIAVVGTSKSAVEQGAELVSAGIEWPKQPPPLPPKPDDSAGTAPAKTPQ